jgi:hypothetical protein
MIYVLRNKKFPQRILIGAPNGVVMWQRLKSLLVKKGPSWGTLKDWEVERTLEMVDWCCWVY